MSTTKAGGGRARGASHKPPPPTRPATPREQWDRACARFVDAVMADDPTTARVALAESFVALGYLDEVTP